MPDTRTEAAALPRTVGKYRILRLIGSGGMGTVYEATDVFLRRSVALKVLSPISESFQDALERFFREARAVARLQHPNIVRIYDADDDPAAPFIAMELVKGIDAGELIRRRPDLPTALSVAAQVFEGLAHAHDLGVVHRDVKPANVLIAEDGTAKLIDFGLARLHDDERDLTRGKVFGSACYMSPEQITDPRGVDHRTDVYAAGALLCQLVTGQAPYQGTTLAETLVQVVHGPLPDLRKRAPGCPGEVIDLILACLAKSRDDRPSSAREVAAALRSLASRLSGPLQPGEELGVPAGPPPGATSGVHAAPPPPVPAAALVSEPGPPRAGAHPEDAVPYVPPSVSRPFDLPELDRDLSSYEIGEEVYAEALPAPRPAPRRRPRRAVVGALAAAVVVASVLLGALVLLHPGEGPRPSPAAGGELPPLALGGAAAPGSTSGPAGTGPAGEPGPRLVAVEPAPGTMRVRVGRGEAYEFRVALSSPPAGAPLPVWRLDDAPVAEGDRFVYRAPVTRGRQLVTVSWGDGSDRPPLTLLWYVDVD
ncbi:serine/threonine protein kinase [Acidobacteria bacterium ACD]|nr:MAG: serine/threonine protein kinase [Acidobacteriota bacterium]MDL1950052.1 serine/threonine protein kinase [Acidobacteria bacterium ACD]